MEEKGRISDDSKPSGFTFEEYILIFIRYKKTILFSTGVAFLFSVILYFFIIKPEFWSTTTIKTTSSGNGVTDLLGGGALPDIGDIGDLAGSGSAAKELALYENILLSRRCLEETINKFNLMDVYDFKHMKWALKHLRDNVITISIDKTAGTMEVGVFDEDPSRAKEIAEFLLFELNKINTELSVQDARNNREFLESRYEVVRKDLRKSEDSLRMFQTIYGISPDLTVQASVKTQIEIEAEIASEKVKLELLRKIISPNEPEIKAQEEKISALNNQLNQLLNSPGVGNGLGLEGKPEIVMNFLRLKRDVEIQNKILSIILPLYEQAKIEENRETPSILIVDPPFIPDYKEKPKRATGVIIFTGGVFVLINILLIGLYKLKQFRAKLANYKEL